LVCSACSKLVLPLVDHDDARVRQVAAWWLVRRGARSALFVEMAERLGRPDSKLARNAADVLGEMRMLKAIPSLGAALNNPAYDGEARASMARALGQIGHMGAIAALTQAMAADKGEVRAAAAAALRDLRGYSDPSPAAALLNDRDVEVRLEAIDSIAYTRSQAMRADSGNAIAQQLVNLAASDPDERVRKKAVWALGEIGAPIQIAGPVLQQVSTGDESPFVRSLATAALSRLAR
jgi:HEAT repeat protein